MITRSQLGIVKPIHRLSLNTFSISPIPKNLSHALNDPHWRNVMYDEYNALVKNGTWFLVPRPAGVNMVCSVWLFKQKFHADGTLSRYKARLVANDISQQVGVNFDETFSPVPPGFVDSRYPHHVCLLQRSVYGLKQAPRAWVLGSDLFTYLLEIELLSNLLFNQSLQQIIDSLHNEFEMTDLGTLNYFLGISATRTPIGLFLSQKKYALQLLEHAHMVNCNPSRTPVDTKSKLVQQICLYMHDPREPHFAALKRILRYVAHPHAGLLQVTVFFWVIIFCRGQLNVSTLSLALVSKLNIMVLLTLSPRQLGFAIYFVSYILLYRLPPLFPVITLVPFICLPTLSNINVRDMVTAGQVRVLHVPSRYQYADIFTKGPPSALFEDFRSILSVRSPPAQIAGAY
ncbi:ribonuclease H-like domain-containing protein [Tanacetum coccineum]